MNATKEQAAQFGFDERLAMYQNSATQILKVAPRMLFAYNTLQFKDYSKYEFSIFSEMEKRAYREENFPKLCDEAYKIGRELIGNAMAS